MQMIFFFTAVINLFTYFFLSPFENFLFSDYTGIKIFYILGAIFQQQVCSLFPEVVLVEKKSRSFLLGVHGRVFQYIDANFCCKSSENTLKMASKCKNRQKNETGSVDEPNRKFRTHASQKKYFMDFTWLRYS